MKSGCSNWDRDWGDCGRCTYCIAKAAREDTQEAFRRLNARIDELAEQIAKILGEPSA